MPGPVAGTAADACGAAPARGTVGAGTGTGHTGLARVLDAVRRATAVRTSAVDLPVFRM